MKTIFVTPGNFELDSLETFGLNVKPNSKNPIGYFGTGLKYAIAVLLREGATIDLYCNGDHYTFYLDWKTFRGENYKRAYVKRTNFKWSLESKVTELPFTEDLGKNWQLWQAFRELYANTLDENGTVFTSDQWDPNPVNEGYTEIVIDHLEFSRLVDKRDEIFLPQERELLFDTESGNVTAGKSKHLYYRGMRAFDLPEKTTSIFTWNIIEEQELTEDRTIKSQYSYHREVRDLVAKSKNKEIIKAVLNAPKDTFEASLDFSYTFSASDEYVEVLKENRDNKNLNPSAYRYYSTYVAPPKTPFVSDAVWEKIKLGLEMANNRLAKDEVAEPELLMKVYNTYLVNMQTVMER